jgi:hypothetical protein
MLQQLTPLKMEKFCQHTEWSESFVKITEIYSSNS